MFSFPTTALWPIIVFALAVFTGCENPAPPNPASEPVARVETWVAKTDTLAEVLDVYGTVVAAPGARQSPSVPFEAVVRRVLVSEGMPVEAGQPLLTLRPSQTSERELTGARTALHAADTSLRTARSRDSLGLGTRDQLARAEQVFRDARTRLDQVEQWIQLATVSAPAPGVVVAVHATEGAILAPGTPLMDLALEGRFEVRLGIEPDDMIRIQKGRPVTVQPIGTHREPAYGAVRSVARAINPDTRLVDVMVTLSEDAPLLFGERVRGEIDVRSGDGLIVPRSAVLPHDGAYQLFTLRDGRAVAHLVRLGVETDSLVEILGGRVAAGDSIVVLGNYVLRDSMRVRTTAPSPTAAVN